MTSCDLSNQLYGDPFRCSKQTKLMAKHTRKSSTITTTTVTYEQAHPSPHIRNSINIKHYSVHICFSHAKRQWLSYTVCSIVVVVMRLGNGVRLCARFGTSSTTTTVGKFYLFPRIFFVDKIYKCGPKRTHAHTLGVCCGFFSILGADEKENHESEWIFAFYFVLKKNRKF